jgi:hypothetical protein
MSDIHYFQRYSVKENVVTNTTLHLFSWIYEHSPKRLRALLNEVFDDDIPIGLGFSQQVRGPDSVPDGAIHQPAVKITIETKVDAGVNVGQLLRHLGPLGASGSHHLLLLTKDDIAEATLAPIFAAADSARVNFVHCTFERLCKHLGDNVREFEIHLKPVIDDFIAYCNEMGLLPDRRIFLRIVACGNSHTLNRKYGTYFHPTDRPYISQRFLGIYWGKSVRLIGEVKSVFDATLVAGVFTKNLVSGAATDEFDQKIIGMINETPVLTGWNVSTGHRFYCTSGFRETDYRKVSPYGIMGPRLRDVSEMFPSDATLDDLAANLRNATWD